MKIILSSDHKDETFNSKLIKFFEEIDYIYEDISHYSDKDVNYIIEGIKIGESVSYEGNTLGIVISNHPLGVVMAANKVNKIRCINIHDEDNAKDLKKTFNPNVIVIRPSEINKVIDTIKEFLYTEYDEMAYNHGINTLLDYENSCVDC